MLGMVRFILPPALGPSGGNVYNRRMIAEASAAGFPLHPCLVPTEVLLAGEDVALWDSLLMPVLASSEGFHGKQVLLMHYLPSLDPGLEEGARSHFRAIEDTAIDRVTALIVTGQGLAQSLSERYPRLAIHVCEPGVDPVFRSVRTGRDCPVRTANLLTVANIVPAKGHRSLAGVLVRMRDLDWRWHLVGVCPDERLWDELYGLFGGHGIEDRLIRHGALSQEFLAGLMEDMDLALQASRYEAYGMAVAEATAAGIPVVATRVGEAARLVHDGVSGFLPAWGDWSQYERQVRLLLDDPALRLAMGQAGARLPVRSWAAAGADFMVACQAISAG